MLHFRFLATVLAGVFLLTFAPVVRCQEPQASVPPPSSARTSTSPSQTAAPDFSEPRRLLQQGKFDDALAELLDLQKQHPSTKGLSHELGTAYYKKGDFLNAALYLKKAQQEDPSDGEATQLLGLSYYLAGRPAEAIPALER